MESQKNKIFQSKVIIGSITSFVVAAVGVVAVFFPSLLNLEKKSIPEKEIFLHSKENLDELYKFLQKNVGKPVKLTLAHCFNPKRADLKRNRGDVSFWKAFESWNNMYNFQAIKEGETYVEHIGTNPRINIDDEFDIIAGGKIQGYIDAGEGNIDGIYLENGAFAYRAEEGIYHEISIPHSSNGNKKYKWAIGSAAEIYESKLYKKTSICGLDYAQDRIIPISYLSGHFFVNEGILGGDYSYFLDTPYSESLAYYQIELEPLDKKDLELRNY